jgi:deoxyadenosine/deoxycytidine kinase
MGSGKTTLAFSLVREFGWTYIPESPQATRYLGDIIKNPHRWAFETQIAFLTQKALSMLKALDAAENIILDRSPHEDAEIFAAYHYESGHFDERAFETYQATAEFVLRTLPPPDVIVHCLCTPETCERRLTDGRGVLKRGSLLQHLRDIDRRYADWISSHKSGPVYSVDSELFDLRRPSIVKRMAAELNVILRRQTEPTSAAPPPQDDSHVLKPIRVRG